MEHFLACQVDLSHLTYVLCRYPRIILPKTTIVQGPEKLMDIPWDSSYLPSDSSGLSGVIWNPHYYHIYQNTIRVQHLSPKKN